MARTTLPTSERCATVDVRHQRETASLSAASALAFLPQVSPASMPANRGIFLDIPTHHCTLAHMQPTLPDIEPHAQLLEAGFRFGDKGTHTSRTIMLAELTELLGALPLGAERAECVTAIVDDNVLGKHTAATRRLTSQRLTELYGLDPRVPMFRVLRHLWSVDEPGRPLLALLCALARDPLLRSTGPAVLELPAGSELVRATFIGDLREAVGSRLNDSILDKVARNTASSWSQTGHLEGRVRKIRRRVTPTPGATAMALWMGALEGLAGEQLFSSRWARVLDRSSGQLAEFALQAKQLGFVHARIGGGVVEIDTRPLDTPLKGL